MNDDRLHRMLDRPAPDEQAAEERGWQVVRAAHARREAPARRSQTRRILVALAATLVLLAGALTPPGQAVADWVKDAVDPGRDDARPALVSLPSRGRLLVNSEQGPWIVAQDGSRRLLGGFDEASWSPGGLFVIATRGRELVALEPGGRPRWSLARPAPVSRARWSPDGFRVAYLSGRELRVVAGDGTNDERIAQAALAAPAWRPGTAHELAYVDPQGRVRVLATDSRRELWRSKPASTAPTQLDWSHDGRRLLAVAPTVLRLFDAEGRPADTLELPTGTLAGAAAFRPSGDGFALTTTHAMKLQRGRIAVVRLGRGASVERVLLTGAGGFGDVAWSPDGQWLLATWPSANQWVFIRAGERRRGGIDQLRAVANISQQFAPGTIGDASFPGLGGWCCPQRERSR